jgi:hypothetical protein
VITIGVAVGGCDDVAACERECDAGSADRCRRLAATFALGQGAAQDETRAAALYAHACDMNDPSACVFAGQMSEYARGVDKDDAKAARFYRRACDLQRAPGCYNLGIMFERGTGVPQDRGQTRHRDSRIILVPPELAGRILERIVTRYADQPVMVPRARRGRCARRALRVAPPRVLGGGPAVATAVGPPVAWSRLRGTPSRQSRRFPPDPVVSPVATRPPHRPPERPMTPTDAPPASAPRLSLVSIRMPSVMLVRIERGEEPAGLDLDELPLQVFRVRHPLPACTRMCVLRPEVVLVGPSVLPRDLARVIEQANEIQAAVVWTSLLGMTDSLRERLLELVDVVRQRRSGRVKLAHAG